tara:strand:+ start:736 stop:1011 length:276 start_codon:yes stop_codon:yes gene_type:complete
MESSGRSASGVDAAVATAEVTLAAALETLRIATDSIGASTTTKAAAALASAAVKDLSPSDLDEIRAIRSSPHTDYRAAGCLLRLLHPQLQR